MKTIFLIMHRISAIIICFLVTLIEIPIKGFLVAFFTLFGLFCSIFYPLVKNWEGPDWLQSMYDYLFLNKWLCKKVWKIYMS